MCVHRTINFREVAQIVRESCKAAYRPAREVIYSSKVGEAVLKAMMYEGNEVKDWGKLRLMFRLL